MGLLKKKTPKTFKESIKELEEQCFQYNIKSFLMYLVITISVVYSCVVIQNDFNKDFLFVIFEIYYAILLIFLLIVTIGVHRKSFLHWLSLVTLLSKYAFYILPHIWSGYSIGFHLGLMVCVFVAEFSYTSAVQICGKKDKVLITFLTIGLALVMFGIFLAEKKYKWVGYIGGLLLYICEVASLVRILLCYGTKKSKPELGVLIFVIIEYIVVISSFPFIIQSCFKLDMDVVYNLVVPIYSAVLGGVLTLGGVAWTINKGDKDRKSELKRLEEERKEEEKKKAKPLFGFYMDDGTTDNRNFIVRFEDSIYQGKHLSDGNIEKYPLFVTAILNNTEKSSFNICRIFHSNQWWNVCANKLIFAKGQMNFEFFCKEEKDVKIIEIEDVFGNLYYYQIDIKMDINKGYKQKGLTKYKQKQQIYCDIVNMKVVDEKFVLENTKGE